jgi:predicted short-subunit dehydrogenase-like oxidoreductase (DUF2520 family)
MTSRMAVTPFGSCTRSRVTWKTRPLKTVLDDKTLNGRGADEFDFGVFWAVLLRADMFSTIKQRYAVDGRAGWFVMLAAMRKTTSKRVSVSIVGPGRLGSALAVNLAQVGYEVKFLVTRSRKPAPTDVTKLARQMNAEVVALGQKTLDTGLVWITVPDDEIAVVAEKLAATAEWRGRTVFHSSGALTSDVLSPLRTQGAKVASVHPIMTFVRRSTPTFEGVPFGVEGDAEAVRLARKLIHDVGGLVIPIKKQNKVLYHAFGTFASPMVIALMASLEQVGKAAGVKTSQLRIMAGPLLRQTLSNYLQHGAAASFSGPLVRGDVATIRSHLAALQATPQAREAYISLARSAIKHLPVENKSDIEKELAEPRRGKRSRKA